MTSASRTLSLSLEHASKQFVVFAQKEDLLPVDDDCARQASARLSNVPSWRVLDLDDTFLTSIGEVRRQMGGFHQDVRGA
jgi:hypothetical protein